MQAFEYANPTTLQEALGLLGSKWGETGVLAGGTDLISLMKEYLETPKRVVNIKGIKELGGIQTSKTGLRIGSTVTLEELIEYAVMVDTVNGFGTVGMTTLTCAPPPRVALPFATYPTASGAAQFP